MFFYPVRWSNNFKGKKVHVFFCPISPVFPKSIAFWKVSRLRPKRNELRGTEKENVTRNFIVCTAQSQVYGLSDREEWDGCGMWHVWGTGEVLAAFWEKDLMETDHLKDLGLAGRIILIRIFKKLDAEAWTGLFCLRIGTGGHSFWMLWCFLERILTIRLVS